MTRYREILRLWSLGLKKKEIAESCWCSRNTVTRVLQRMAECGLSYPLPEEMTDKILSEKLFPSGEVGLKYKMPDYEYVHREMAKSGVTMNLLWLEYCDRCREASEIPYQATQFSYSTNGSCFPSRKPKRGIYSKSSRLATKKPLPFSAPSLNSAVGTTKLANPRSLTLSATELLMLFNKRRTRLSYLVKVVYHTFFRWSFYNPPFFDIIILNIFTV